MSDVLCPTCDGRRWVRLQHRAREVRCPDCGGSGRVAIDTAGREVAREVRAALEVYDAALSVCGAVLDLPAPRPAKLVVATRQLMRALAVVGVLDPRDELDPAAVLRLSPRPSPDGPPVIGPGPDGG